MPSRPLALLFLSLVAGALALGGCSKETPQKAAPGQFAPIVKIATAALKDVPLRIDAVGAVEAYSAVSVTAQVNGQIEKVHFAEGDHVSKGELLVTLDQRPFKAALNQAAAILARDTAQMENAKKEAERSAALARDGVLAQADAERSQAAADAATAAVAADRAALENTRLMLEYGSIRSPISGKTGAVLLNEGNLIKANDKTLVTIYQMQPIYVAFSLPQRHLAALRVQMARHKLEVTAAAPGDDGPPAEGTLEFLDNAVDAATGTIKLKALFPNRGGGLVPGQFVNVTLTLAVDKDALTIPAHAVVTGQQGAYVFVVKPDGTAEMRPVTVARLAGAEAVIAEGVREGETVVTDGQLQVRPGGKVKPAAGDTAPRNGGQ